MSKSEHADLVKGYTRNCSRVFFDSDLSQNPMANLRCAVVFAHAFWSGPSFTRLSHMADVIAKHDPKGHVKLVVCDTDRVPHIAEPPYNVDVASGMGEVLWIHNGIVRARHGRRCGERDFAITTLSLVAEHEKDCHHA